MTTSFNNTRLIEKYLQGEMSPAEKFLFEAQLLINPGLRMDVRAQKTAYALVGMYHRKKIREELETIHRQIFSDPEKAVYQQQVYQLFKQEGL
ncbi:MAG: hypothetical protein ABFD10_15945 [Prolixibacteraceae bacterium]